MNLLKLVFRVNSRKLLYFTIFGLISGLANTAVLVLLNRHLVLLTKDQEVPVLWYAIGYGIAILVFVMFNRMLSGRLIRFTHQSLFGMRLEIIRNLFGTDVENLRKSRDEIYVSLTRDINLVADSFFYITQVLSALITILCCFIYLGVLSLTMLLITMGVLLLGVGVYMLMLKSINIDLREGRGKAEGFMKYLNQVLNGSKEIKINPRKGADIYNNYLTPVLGEAKDRFSSGFSGLVNARVIGQLMLLSYIAVILLVVPGQYPNLIPLLINFAFILLYVIRPIEVIINILPPITVANISAKRIIELKEKLAKESYGNADNTSSQFYDIEVESLEMQDLVYEYKSESGDSFALGPVNWKVRAGEMIFIHGGNGSGKTTFIKNLLGLYRPTAGEILVNGIPVTEEDLAAYRSHFTTVFSDFHLFDRLYGINNPDAERVRTYLELFEIDHKVSWTEGGFSTTELSTGQRKRLALIASLMEERPLIVLDEWASDQDPQFRKKFYEEILPLLKQQGITVIAITHDDRYFHISDRLYKMEYGKITEDDSYRTTAAPYVAENKGMLPFAHCSGKPQDRAIFHKETGEVPGPRKRKKLVRVIALMALCTLWIAGTFYKLPGVAPAGYLLGYSQGIASVPIESKEDLVLQTNFNGSVSISIDTLGIPHIFGKDAPSVAYGLGYMHAKDRYFQMEMMCQMVQGRLSESLGKKAVNLDRFWVSKEVDSKARQVLQDFKSSDPELYTYIHAYGEGVREYLQSRQAKTFPEYAVLGKQPMEWEDHHSLMVSWYMSFVLSFTDVHVQRQIMLEKLPADVLQILFPLHPDNQEYIIPSPDSKTVEPRVIAQLKANPALTSIHEFDMLQYYDGKGSNNWAISDEKSAMNEAVLCNDPHLALSLPTPFYEVQLACPEFHAYGFSLPAAPFVISGHNENIAWGITNAEWDVSERYLLKVNPENPNQYEVDGAWKNMERKDFVLQYPNGKDTTLHIKYTDFGQVIETDSSTYAFMWHPGQKNYSFKAFYGLGKAKNWDNFREALSYYSYPPQNFVYADKENNIGMLCAGKMPLKPAGYAGGLLDGTQSVNWEYIPIDSLPQVYNPSRNFVSSANQEPVNNGTYYNFHWAKDNFRAKRINQVLSSTEKIEVQDLKDLFEDQKDLSVALLQQLLMKYRLDAASPVNDEFMNWNGTMEANGYLPVVSELIRKHIVEEVTGSVIAAYGLPEESPVWTPSFKQIGEYFIENDTLTLDHTFLMGRGILTVALQKTDSALHNKYGDDWRKKADYGTDSEVLISNISGIPGLGARVPAFGGNKNTVNVHSNVHAAFRSMVIMSEPVQSYMVLAGGQSGKWNNANYRDQLGNWKDNDMRKTQFSNRESQLRGITQTIKILPK
ncbi:cyclic peptide export ABC transporter [Roseivirga sp. BDSF3-8]|uniref:cyclic peptide export ABC transporter n=1 Tax=Roseivirga sp. BDSF3-8 TaxID=3241598 RepID=UPI003531A072